MVLAALDAVGVTAEVAVVASSPAFASRARQQ